MLAATFTVAALGGFATLFSMWRGSYALSNAEALRIAVRELEAGRPSTAAQIAETLTFDPETEADLERERLFVLGAGSVAHALSIDAREQQRLELDDAIPLLKVSREQGFTHQRATMGMKLLGRAFYEVGRYPEAAAILDEAIQRDPSSARDLLPQLVESQVRSPGMADAAVASAQRLAELAAPNEPLWWEAQLMEARGLTAQGRWDAAQQAIAAAETAGAPADRIALTRAELMFESAIARVPPDFDSDSEELPGAVVGLLTAALDEIKQVLGSREPRTAVHARYLAARALHMLGRADASLTLLVEMRQWPSFKPEMIAAGILELEILAASTEKIGVLEAADSLMRLIGDPRTFDPTWMTVEELRRRLVDVVRGLQEAQHFQMAIDLAALLPPLVPQAAMLRLQGIVYRAWAENTPATPTAADAGEVPAETEPQENPAELRRKRFRAAGNAFAKAAFLDFETAEFVPQLWDAIQDTQRGSSYHESLRLIDEYLRYENHARRPRGLIAKGRALLALNRSEDAIHPLQACVDEYPRDPLRYEARLLAALAHADSANLDASLVLLNDNLNDPGLSPDSPAWRDSLFLLGDLLFRKGYDEHLEIEVARPQTTFTKEQLLQRTLENHQVLREAAMRLEEAVLRYPEDARAIRTRYLSAVAQRMAAEGPQAEADQTQTHEAARRQLRQQFESHMQTAIDGFAELRTQLDSRQELGPLSPEEERILRICYLSEADVLFDLERYPQAASRYQDAAHRFGNQPAALEAILGEARCYQATGQPQDADRLYRQAQQILGRIPPELDSSIARTTRYDRAGWTELLEWLQPN